jgi:pSer/pThr/pTyr-binding forkhead associated (FHA) protein
MWTNPEHQYGSKAIASQEHALIVLRGKSIPANPKARWKMLSARIILNTSPFTIGRGRENHLHLPGVMVSRQHAKMVQVNHAWYLQDLHSLNGTFVNDQRLQQSQKLNPGDQIRIGTNLILYS